MSVEKLQKTPKHNGRVERGERVVFNTVDFGRGLPCKFEADVSTARIGEAYSHSKSHILCFFYTIYMFYTAIMFWYFGWL
jgi:hypothetical protein